MVQSIIMNLNDFSTVFLSVFSTFDRFYTVQNAKGATGIGLSIAKLLIEKMCGKIYVEWENGMISIVVELSLCRQDRMQ